MIRGNHDKVVCGVESGDLFNPVALKAARWTTEKLTPRNRKFLEALPARARSPWTARFAICHGSPRDEDAYIFTDYDAYLNFRETDAAVCFFGHSHIPSVFTLEPHGILVELVEGDRVPLPAREGAALPHQPGLDRPAARPQRRRGLRDLRRRRAASCTSTACRTRPRRRATRSTRRACRTSSATACSSGA